jgi:hypothetical protein
VLAGARRSRSEARPDEVALGRGALLGTFLFVMQAFPEAELEVEAKAVVVVRKSVARRLPRQLEDVLKFDTNAVGLDVAGA